MLADLIFPVFTTPYFLIFGIPWVIIIALLSEIFVYRIWIKEIEKATIAGLTLGANIVSWLAGGFISLFLPFGFAMREVDAQNRLWFPSYAVAAAFLIAWAMSVLLEGAVWKLARRKQPELPIWRATLVANAVSYLLLLVTFFMANHFSLRWDVGWFPPSTNLR